MDTLKAVLVILVIFLGLPLLIVWLNDKIFHRTASKNEHEEDSNRFRERLLNPDFAGLETHFGCAMPPELRALYTNKEVIQKGDFEVLTKMSDGSEASWAVAFYEPADLESLRDAWPDCREFIAFADDGCGNGYLIDPRKAASEVFFHDHETGEFTRVSPNLAAFLAAPRKNSDD